MCGIQESQTHKQHICIFCRHAKPNKKSKELFLTHADGQKNKKYDRTTLCISNTPLKIKFDKENVIANFDINTIHQAVTSEEQKLWKKFILNYQRTIETGNSLTSENQIELKKYEKDYFFLILIEK